jgi:gliding motility-associated-like protein
MRNLLSSPFFLLLLSLSLISPVKAQTTAIPDPNFELALINSGLDTGPVNGSVPTANIRDVTILDVANKNISSLTGIQEFVSLTRLYCNTNSLTSLDVTYNTALTILVCDRNRLTALDVSKNPSLETLLCTDNQITALDVSKNFLLKNLSVDDNRLQALDVSNNIDLVSLGCGNNRISSLDVSKNTGLNSLGCESNLLTSLDVTKNSTLSSLGFDNNQIPKIDVTKNPLLYSLVCYNNPLGTLDVSKNPNLTILDCAAIGLSALDVTTNPKLTFIRCLNNQITVLDVSKNTALTSLWCYNNFLTDLDVTNNNQLNDLRCNNNLLTSLNLKNGTNNLLVNMVALSNPDLRCIQVDNPVLSASYTWWYKDIIAQYGEYCAPRLISFSPATACTGQPVTIKGINLNVVNTVKFGGVTASSVTVLSGTTIRAVVGSGASGDIEVVTPGGAATLPGFIFKQSGPAATISISSSANDICPGSPVTFTAVSANVGSTPLFQWKLNGVDVGGNSRSYSNSSLINGDRINCVMTTIKECPNTKFVYSDTITMIIKPAAEISFNPAEHAIAPGSSVVLNATVTGSLLSYLWTPATGLNDPLSLNPVAAPQATTIYNLSVVGTSNCITDKKIKVAVHKYIQIPNSFSPNGDGLNDIFRVPPGTDLDLQIFSIFDRMGNEVFKTSDISKGWDGRHKGQLASPGVYTYLLKGKDPRGDVFLKGTVILIYK